MNRPKQQGLRNRASSDALFRMRSATIEKILIATLLGAVCLFILYPLLCILFRSFQDGAGTFTFSMYTTVWQQYGTSLVNSIFVGTATALVCTLFSTATALFLSTRRGWVKLLCLGLLLITMVSPPFVSSLAYIQLYGRRGWITYRLLGLSWDPYNCWGIIWMQSISFLPLNALFLYGILSQMDQDSLMAAQDLGATPGARLKDVVLPLIRPGILVCFLLTFVRSLADFGTPVIIGGRFNTIASDIYLQLTGYSNLEKASAMNMFLLLPSIGLFFAYRYLMGKSSLLLDSGRAKQGQLQLSLRHCGIRGILITSASLLFFLMMILQYSCIFLSGFLKSSKGVYTFTTAHLQELWRYDATTLGRSVLYALIVAVVGSLFAMLFAYYMDRRHVPGRSFFDCLATIPYMLPGTCFGIGYILAFNHPPLKLTGTAFIILANMLFKQLPTTTKICSATLKQTSSILERSVQDLGGGRFAILRDVILPGLRPAFLSCFVYNFSTSMTTAGAILFLINPGQKLAVFKLFDAVYTGEYAVASLIATLIILIVLLVEGLVYCIAGKAGIHRVS